MGAQALAPLPAVKLKAFVATQEAATQLLEFEGELLMGLQSNNARTAEVWRSDGTVPGTERIHQATYEAYADVVLTSLGDRVLFISGPSLWSTDGTAQRTVRLRGLTENTAYEMKSLGNLAFLGRRFSSGPLLQSDGTVAGTHAVEGAPGEVWDFAASQGRLWMNASTALNGSEPWTTDGTPGSTRLVLDIDPGPYPRDGNPGDFVPLRGFTYFRATESNSGTELWRSDGTAEGTALAVDIGPGDSYPVQLFPWKDHVYFWLEGPGYSEAFYRSDGTPAGTHRVGTSVTSGSLDAEYVAWGDYLFFNGMDSAGDELWRTDGTTEGTVRVADLIPGQAGSLPASLRLMSPTGPLVFVAATPDTGRELWRLDSPLGTPTLAADVFAGTEGSSPENLTVVGTDLFFTAWDATGNGLFKLSGLVGGTEMDGGTEFDGGTDGGMEPDAGEEDGGTLPFDGGTELDGGFELDAGTDAGQTPSDSGTEPDAGSADAGSTDAGSRDAGLADAGTGEPPPDSGCGCQSTSASVPWSLALMGLFFSARRRSRQK
ncbi:MYXO-CTERM sorting domain-containing protein [Pyxidicoccus sp. 3LG]